MTDSPVPRERKLVGRGPCGLCGSDPAEGIASVDQLCHIGERSCYHRWTVYGARPWSEAPDA